MRSRSRKCLMRRPWPNYSRICDFECRLDGMMHKWQVPPSSRSRSRLQFRYAVDIMLPITITGPQLLEVNYVNSPWLFERFNGGIPKSSSRHGWHGWPSIHVETSWNPWWLGDPWLQMTSEPPPWLHWPVQVHRHRQLHLALRLLSTGPERWEGGIGPTGDLSQLMQFTEILYGGFIRVYSDITTEWPCYHGDLSIENGDFMGFRKWHGDF